MRRIVAVVFLMVTVAWITGCGEKITHDIPLDHAVISSAQAVAGLDMTASEQSLMLADLIDQREAIRALRGVELPNYIFPTIVLRPWPVGWTPTTEGPEPIWSTVEYFERPDDLNELAFATVGQLAHLLENRKVTSLELTRLFLNRLKEYGPELECVVNIDETAALESAAGADQAISEGRYRGMLHGVPFGVKDLLAVQGAPTTWGAEPFRDQVIDHTATVVERLQDAGAVLVGKLSLGALAMGDVWFDGTTRNPWNLEEGSSGSSAGPASAVSAGLVPFAIGSETWGSIVSPSTRCGVTGLRPTFGRVSRDGAMALSWSMDKLGPMARSVEDCAIVLDCIQGPDGRDPSVIQASFPYNPQVEVRGLRIGYLAPSGGDPDMDESSKETRIFEEALVVLQSMGAQLIELDPIDFDAMPLSLILSVEAAAAFEQLTIDGRDDDMVSQGRFAWPNAFRAAHFIPAVAYVQANRARSILIELMAERMKRVDLYVAPPFVGQDLLITNLTGHPSITMPAGMLDEDSPHSITFTGRLFDEATLLAVARAWQEETAHHLLHPPGYVRQ